MRVFTSFFLLILTARVVGLEYQLGNIRVLLACGIGRLQLLFAKLLAVVVIALSSNCHSSDVAEGCEGVISNPFESCTFCKVEGCS